MTDDPRVEYNPGGVKCKNMPKISDVHKQKMTEISRILAESILIPSMAEHQ